MPNEHKIQVGDFVILSKNDILTGGYHHRGCIGVVVDVRDVKVRSFNYTVKWLTSNVNDFEFKREYYNKNLYHYHAEQLILYKGKEINK